MESRFGILINKQEERGTGKTGKPYTRYVLIVNEDGKEHKYSTFEAAVYNSCEIGDYLELVGVQEGAFWTLKYVKESNPNNRPQPPKQEITPVTNQPNASVLDKEVKIIRQNAMAHAVNIITKCTESKNEDFVLKQAFKLAEQIEKWVLR